MLSYSSLEPPTKVSDLIIEYIEKIRPMPEMERLFGREILDSLVPHGPGCLHPRRRVFGLRLSPVRSVNGNG